MREATLESVRSWLERQGPVLPDTVSFVAALARRLEGVGLEPVRVAFNLQLLHPRFQARTLSWQRGKDGVDEMDWPRAVHETDTYRKSPAKAVIGDGEVLRYRLDSAAAGHPIDDELRAQGAVEYLGIPLSSPSGLPHAFSLATRRADGFTNDEVVALMSMAPTLAKLVDLPLLLETSRNVATLWKGSQRWSGPGEERSRGGAERSRGVLVSLELQGVHGTAGDRPAHEGLEQINRWYHLATRATHRFEGEVLHMFAEQVLVFFPAPPGQERTAAQRGAALVRAARASLFDLADMAQPRPVVPDLVAAVDLDEVIFGTSSSGGRLDFTVIGPAIERLRQFVQLGRDRGEWVLLSECVAAALDARTRPVPCDRIELGQIFTLVPDPEADTLI